MLMVAMILLYGNPGVGETWASNFYYDPFLLYVGVLLWVHMGYAFLQHSYGGMHSHMLVLTIIILNSNCDRGGIHNKLSCTAACKFNCSSDVWFTRENVIFMVKTDLRHLFILQEI